MSPDIGNSLSFESLQSKPKRAKRQDHGDKKQLVSANNSLISLKKISDKRLAHDHELNENTLKGRIQNSFIVSGHCKSDYADLETAIWDPPKRFRSQAIKRLYVRARME